MECHRCKHQAAVQAGEYRNVEFSKTPCSQCTLTEDSRRTKEYDEERRSAADPVCEDVSCCQGEEEPAKSRLVERLRRLSRSLISTINEVSRFD